ncbi:MAG: hypothetical protein HY015_11150 [Bacteroidetes bacterium]|nr:hypothetical protein [Bacteroidota bacterium]MBI3483507.1 hypothetical protein [Bacteroidota bacterium]
MNQKQILLPGKIAGLSSDQTCIIHDLGEIRSKFQLRNDKEFSYSGLRWMYNDDSFIGVEYLRTESGRIYKGNIVRFGINGEIIDRIYESEDGELAGDTYPSRNDKKLLVTTERIGDKKKNPLEGLSRKQSVMIMDLEHKKVIKKIENIGSSPSLQIEESPWLYNGDRFVYSITSGRKIVNEGEVINPVEEGYAGVYIYDLTTDQKKLLIPGGRFAIASPIDNRVAYIKNNKSINVLDLNNNLEETVYEIGSKEKVPNVHWTPDGKHIYLVYFDYYLGLSDLFTSGEKLIEVSTGTEIPFEKIGHGFTSYTWK